MRRPEQQIVFVSGKGGVGKTAVASALAVREARTGKKVLLAELGEKSFLRFVFPEAGKTTPVEVSERLSVVRWEVESCLREYLLYYLKVERLVDLFFANPIMRPFLDVAPALPELAILGKITSGPRGIGPDMPYDLVVVDTFATGHFRALLQAPQSLSRAVGAGPMGEQSRTMVEVLKNPQQTKIILVALPEELPVNETEELKNFLKQEVGVSAQIVLNRNLPIPLAGQDFTQVQEQLRQAGLNAYGLNDFTEYLRLKEADQEKAWARIKSWQLKASRLPWHLTNSWPELLQLLAQDLDDPWT